MPPRLPVRVPFISSFIVADDLQSGALIALELDLPTIEVAIYTVFLPAQHPAARGACLH